MHPLLLAVQNADLAVYHLAARFAGNWMLDRIMGLMEANNLFKGGIFFIAYWYLWFQPGPRSPERRRHIVVTLISALVALAVARGTAMVLPFRYRPSDNPALVHPAYSMPWAPNMEDWSSFPSDHAACFFALALGLAYLLRRFAFPIFAYTAVWICVPRLYLGIHYVSDMVSGAVIGMAAAWVCLRSGWLRVMVARPVVAWERSHPAGFYALAFLCSYEMAVLFDDVRNIGRGILHVIRSGGGGLLHDIGMLALLVIGIALAGGTGICLWRFWRQQQAGSVLGSRIKAR